MIICKFILVYVLVVLISFCITYGMLLKATLYLEHFTRECKINNLKVWTYVLKSWSNVLGMGNGQWDDAEETCKEAINTFEHTPISVICIGLLVNMPGVMVITIKNYELIQGIAERLCMIDICKELMKIVEKEIKRIEQEKGQ